MNRYIFLFLIVLAYFVMFAESDARAEGGPWDLKLRAGDEIAYDDNVTFTRHDRKDNFINNLFVGLDADYEEKFVTAQLSATVTRQFFSSDDQFDNTSQDFAASVTRELSEFKRFTLEDSFVHAQEPRTFEDAFSQQTDFRSSYYKNIFSAVYKEEMSSQLTRNFRYRNELYYPRGGSSLRSFMNSAGVQADYSLSSADLVSPMYDFTLRNYESNGHSTLNAFAANYRHFLTKQLFVDARPGIDVIDPAAGKSVIKPHLTISITDDVDKATRATLVYDKGYRLTSYSREALDSWQVTLYLIRQLLPRLSGSASAFFGEGEYVTSRVTEQLYGVSGALTYEIKQNINAVVSYSHARHDSNDDTQVYTRNVVMCGVVFRF